MTAKIEEVKRNLPQGGNLNHKRFELKRICALHPVTFINDCLECEAHCSILENMLPDGFEALITKPLRDELYEYLFGDNNPIIKIRELTGIPLRVDIKLDEALFNPKKIEYLQDLTEEQYRKHWRIFYKGHHLNQSLGNMQQAGMSIQSLPEEVQELISYYEHHVGIMRGMLDPAKVIKKFDMDQMDDSGVNQMTFASKQEAICILASKITELLKEETQYNPEVFAAIDSIGTQFQDYKFNSKGPETI